MNYRDHLQEAESLLREKHYAACVQKCSALFEAAFKEVYQRYIANIENMVEKKEIQRIEEEIGKNQRTFQRFGFGELVGLARKAKLFERLRDILKHDLDRINTINFGSLVDIRNRVTHQGGEVQEIDAEIFLTGLRAFLLDTQLMEPVLSLVRVCPECGSKASEGAKHCPNCGADLEKSEQPLSPQAPAQAWLKKKWLKKTAVTSLGILVILLAIVYGYALIHRPSIQQANAAYLRGDYATAFKENKFLADQGDSQAQNNLGWMYFNGQGVPQDFTQAMKWFRKAAGQGYATAQTNLGGMYYNGHGVARDYKKAVGWYRKAAEQGDPNAQTDLGLMYEYGQGVAKDYKKAVGWYRKAAEQGDARAQTYLGLIYEHGHGVAKGPNNVNLNP